MIRIDRADKYFNRGRQNEIHVINNVSLELPDVGMIAVFGKSGCGKTTLLNAIGGLDKINSGKIFVDGFDISEDTDTVRNKYIGYIFQNYYLDRGETVYENVASALRLCGMKDEKEIKSRVSAALSNVGMAKYERRLPSALSGGQQQRVAIARALVKNPRIILADEPTGNLDEANTIMVMDLLKKISEQCLVILVTHEANLVDYYCDKVYGIVDGRIDSERVNDGTFGYNVKGKNDIYLGELERKDEKADGISIEYYGPMEDVRLRIVNYGGRLYLSSLTPRLTIIDQSSEIKLHEGVFDKGDRKPESGALGSMDMSHLKPFEGKNFGSMFTFKRSLSSAWHENYAHTEKRRKRSVRLLSVVLILMSFVLVFVTSASAISIKKYTDIYSEYNSKAFIIPIDGDFDSSAIENSIGENGIDYAAVMGSYYQQGETMQFYLGNFNTAYFRPISVRAFVLDSGISDSMRLVAGTRELKDNSIIVSTGLADVLIDGSGTTAVSGYEDVIGFVNGDGMVISGVVESSDKEVYTDPVYAAYRAYSNRVGNREGGIMPESVYNAAFGASVDVSSGDVYLYFQGTSAGNIGDTVKIEGQDYTLRGFLSDSSGYESFEEFAQDYGIQSADEYVSQVVSEGGAEDEFSAYCSWFWTIYADAYMQYIMDYSIPDSVQIYAYSQYNEPIGLLVTVEDETLREELYAAYVWMQNNADIYVFPTADDEEYLRILESRGYTQAAAALEENYIEEYKWYTENLGYMYTYVIDDSDCIRLAYVLGDNSYIGSYEYIYYDKGSEYYEGYYSHSMVVHASDNDAAEGYLREAYGDSLITPKDLYEEGMSDQMTDILSGIVSILVNLGLILLGVFFIMRTQIMSRVREIGIYRAIGVSKKNLSFKYFIESLLITMMTVFIGFLAASLIAGTVSSSSLVETFLYYPAWLAMLLGVILCGCSTLFGLIPLALLLCKTPSEILSKYDI